MTFELRAGLTRQHMLDISAYHITTGVIETLPDGKIKLLTGACA